VIFKQALQRELSRTFTATLVVLVTIVMTMMLIRTLGLASKGSVNPQEVMLVMAYSVLGHIPTILTLALFMTLVSTLNRMMRDSEMVIWISSGQSLFSFLRPLLGFAWPILITISVMVLLVWPWSNAQLQTLRVQFEQRGDLERLTPGQFQESSNGQRVFYVDKNSSHHGAQDIFIVTNQGDRQTLTTAQSGSLDTADGERFLVLAQGQRIERSLARHPESAGTGIKLTHFEQLSTRLSDTLRLSDAPQTNAQSTLTLLRGQSSGQQGELAWRLSLLLAALNFVFLALCMTHINPRAAKSGQLMIAMFAFIIYFNGINVIQAWIGSGIASFGAALLGLHGGALAIGATVLWLRSRT
jgi:lipopolysaccharide export system permease protein